MCLKVKLIHLSSLDKVFENRDILLRIKFIFGRVLTRRNKTYRLVDYLHFFNFSHTISDPLSNFFDAFILLLGLLSYSFVNLDKGLL